MPIEKANASEEACLRLYLLLQKGFFIFIIQLLVHLCSHNGCNDLQSLAGKNDSRLKQKTWDAGADAAPEAPVSD